MRFASAAASLAPFPTRLYRLKLRCSANRSRSETVQAARRALLAEAQPIDDIRSTAEYRRRVAANLLESFCSNFAREGRIAMNATLDAWNNADEATARRHDCLLRAQALGSGDGCPAPHRQHVAELSEAADRIWATMEEPDWMEAFACHPRIGERKASTRWRQQSAAWSQQEQSSAASAADELCWPRLPKAIARYEERFGFTYIVCATGKSAEEMLAILKRRLAGDRDAELREAAEQQRQITQIRLGKWLVE